MTVVISPNSHVSVHQTSTPTNTDVLVLGSGSAGLFFALKVAQLSELKILVVTKKSRSESNTNYAQGGIASVLASTDSYESHIHDSLVSGAGLCHTDAVDALVHEGPDRVRELIKLGAVFSRDNSGALSLGLEGGHSEHRIVHAHDLTGRELERALLAAVQNHPNITILEDHYAIELLTDHQRVGGAPDPEHIRCYGAYVLHEPTGRVEVVRAAYAVMLATGGAGQVYLHTTNPEIATADGVAMAYRAGGLIGNMEFIQFHPTTLFHPEAHSFLISEAIRGAGAVLQNGAGERFMERYDPQRKDLAPRDIVARAIDSELKRSGEDCAYLDLSRIPSSQIRDEFPNIYTRCLALGLDITAERIPVVPAAHYSCGGVVTDLEGRTNIDCLYASGEVSMTGVHGANRLASNSLLEALVFSNRAAHHLVKRAHEAHIDLADGVELEPWDDSGTENLEEWIYISHDLREVQQLMWDYVGIVRSNYRLQRALRRIRLIRHEIEEYHRRTRVTVPLLELRNVAEVALLIIRSALRRKESRGLHFTTDYPNSDNQHWHHDTLLSKPQKELVN